MLSFHKTKYTYSPNIIVVADLPCKPCKFIEQDKDVHSCHLCLTVDFTGSRQGTKMENEIKGIQTGKVK